MTRYDAVRLFLDRTRLRLPDFELTEENTGALERAAFLACEQGDYERAVALGEEALALARRFKDDAVAATVLFTLGSVAMSRVELERASVLLEETVSLWRNAESAAFPKAA